jgi:hypothetical protein
MPKPAPVAPADIVALYEKLIATNPQVERKGAAIPYTSLNGHMFSMLTKAGKVALRLPEDARDAFLKKYKTKLCEQYGVVQKEYVEVPDTLLGKTRELKKYFDISLKRRSERTPQLVSRDVSDRRISNRMKSSGRSRSRLAE